MRCPPLQVFFRGGGVTEFFFMATILQLKVVKKGLFEKSELGALYSIS